MDYTDKRAFIAKDWNDCGFSKVGDYKVYERHSIGEVKFLHTASFILKSDACYYLKSKYELEDIGNYK